MAEMAVAGEEKPPGGWSGWLEQGNLQLVKRQGELAGGKEASKKPIIQTYLLGKFGYSLGFLISPQKP